MIVSEVVEIEKIPDNTEIENALKKEGIEPLRWAIVEVTESSYKISVSYAKS